MKSDIIFHKKSHIFTQSKFNFPQYYQLVLLSTVPKCESAKLRTLRAFVPYSCPTSCPTCSRALRVLCPTCSRASSTLCPMCSRALRASCPTHLVPYVLLCFKCLMLHMPRALCALFIVLYLCIKYSSIFLWKVTI